MASLTAQNSALQFLADRSDAEKEKLQQLCDKHRSNLSQCAIDHAALQSLHQQLTLDHSELKRNYESLKQQQEE